MRELRFIEQGQVRPNVATLSELFSRPDVWETLPVWKGMLAPGGRLCVFSFLLLCAQQA